MADTLIDRVRDVIAPGMSVTDICARIKAPADDVRKVVSKLRQGGEIDFDVPHAVRGEKLRTAMKNSIGIDMAVRDGFRRAVPEDMAAQIAARVAAGEVTQCPPAPDAIRTFWQAVGDNSLRMA